MNNIRTFVFFDSETTGLPFEENNRTKITEMCFTAVQCDHISLGVYPRIQNKLSLCLNPRKLINPGATAVSGLSNELLEFQHEFDSVTFGIIQDFLNIQQKPICLVAHNGNRFDYPILKAEIHKNGNALSEDILCVDSLLAFRELSRQPINIEQEQPEKEIPLELQDDFDELLFNITENLEESYIKLSVEDIQRMNETTPKKKSIYNVQLPISKRGNNTKKRLNSRRRLPFGRVSFKLGDLYQRLTSKEAINAHRAENDVNMLIECVAIYGQKFVDWSNMNAKLLCDIPIMMPGKPIGQL